MQFELCHEAYQTDDCLSQETCKYECVLVFLSSKLKVKAVGGYATDMMHDGMTSGSEFMKTLMER